MRPSDTESQALRPDASGENVGMAPADRWAERAMRALISQRSPGDSIDARIGGHGSLESATQLSSWFLQVGLPCLF